MGRKKKKYLPTLYCTVYSRKVPRFAQDEQVKSTFDKVSPKGRNGHKTTLFAAHPALLLHKYFASYSAICLSLARGSLLCPPPLTHTMMYSVHCKKSHWSKTSPDYRGLNKKSHLIVNPLKPSWFFFILALPILRKKIVQ